MKSAWSIGAVAALALALAGPAAADEKPGYQAFGFTQYSGQTGYEFAIPKTDGPIRVDISARIDRKPVGASMVFSALLTRDPVSGAVSWIGTDSDGRVTTGNSEKDGVVLARLRAPDGDDYAVLRLAGDKRLKVVQRPAAQGAKGSYSVRVWY